MILLESTIELINADGKNKYHLECELLMVGI